MRDLRTSFLVLSALGIVWGTAVRADSGASPLRFASFQAGFATVNPKGQPNGIYGPYIAFSPLLDFGKLGVRAEVSSSTFHTSITQTYQSLGLAGYLRFPVVAYFANQDKSNGVTVSIRGINLEVGGGEETWWARSDGWQPEVTANFVFEFHWYLERMTFGVTELFIPGGQTYIIRGGVGISLF